MLPALTQVISFSISAKRQRVDGEITPTGVEHSRALNNDEGNYAANHAIDLELTTQSYTDKGPGGNSWLRISLDRVYCITQAVWYGTSGQAGMRWTCSQTDCSKCEYGGEWCWRHLKLIVRIRDSVSAKDLPSFPDCKYGDTVKLDIRPGSDRSSFAVHEISIIGKQSEIRF